MSEDMIKELAEFCDTGEALKLWHFTEHEKRLLSDEDRTEERNFAGKCTRNSALLAKFLDDTLNFGFSHFSMGKQIGGFALFWHRTLQGALFNFALGIIYVIGKETLVDARNAVAVKNASIISKMIDNNQIYAQPLI